MKRYRRALWYIAMAAVAFYVPTFVAFWLLETVIFNGNPRLPQAETGLVVPYLIKGVSVYVSQPTATTLDWLSRSWIGALCIMAASGALAGGLDLKRRISN
jgi:hypothetical protein